MSGKLITKKMTYSPMNYDEVTLDTLLLYLEKLQWERRFDELNELLINLQDASTPWRQVADHFETTLANDAYAQWHRENSDETDRSIDLNDIEYA